LIDRLTPTLGEAEAALDAMNGFRDRPAGTLRLNVPVSAARLVLPAILPGFLAAYSDIQMEVVAEDSFVDVLASGCDAGIRYDKRLEQDMIGSRSGRVCIATPPPPHRPISTGRGRPVHPRDLLAHACLLGRFPSGSMTSP
jgi:DNA-binding transcriptional LysR family regulator